MIYKIYYHDQLVDQKRSIKDMFYFVRAHGYEIIDSIEHLENNYINIYCI